MNQLSRAYSASDVDQYFQAGPASVGATASTGVGALQTVLMIGMAGALGAMSRYAVGLVAHRHLGDHFAYGTLLVNVLGCLLLGALLEVERHGATMVHPVRLMVSVGFLGAFTTFSTFGYETFRYLQAGATNLALLNVSANLVLGLGGVWLGWWLVRSLATVA